MTKVPALDSFAFDFPFSISYFPVNTRSPIPSFYPNALLSRGGSPQDEKQNHLRPSLGRRLASRTLYFHDLGSRRAPANLSHDRHRQRQISAVDRPQLESHRQRILRHEEPGRRYRLCSRLRLHRPCAHGNSAPRYALFPERFGRFGATPAQVVARSNAAGNAAAALASFDAGYFAETLKQLQWIHKGSVNPAQSFDGFSLIKKAIQLRAGDPQMAFAAALITLGGPGPEHQEYARKAIAGARSDSLLARNLSTHFMSPQSETMAEMISRTAGTRMAKQ